MYFNDPVFILNKFDEFSKMIVVIFTILTCALNTQPKYYEANSDGVSTETETQYFSTRKT